MANRVCFLVDGFNVYHSIIEALKAHPADSMKWLDFQAFCTSFLPLISNDATLEKVFYFSASADFRPDKAARHAVLVAALRATGVEVQLGRFKEKDSGVPPVNMGRIPVRAAQHGAQGDRSRNDQSQSKEIHSESIAQPVQKSRWDVDLETDWMVDVLRG